MSKTQEVPANGMAGLGDLSVIRNILFGQQAAEFESQFDQLVKRMDKTDGDHAAHFKQLEADMLRRMEALESATQQRFAKVESDLSQTADRLAAQIAATSQADKASIGQMLIEIGTKLTK